MRNYKENQNLLHTGVVQCWIDFPEAWQWKLYMTVVALTIFLFPTLIITACYAIIVYTIWSKSKMMTVGAHALGVPSESSHLLFLNSIFSGFFFLSLFLSLPLLCRGLLYYVEILTPVQNRQLIVAPLVSPMWAVSMDYVLTLENLHWLLRIIVSVSVSGVC